MKALKSERAKQVLSDPKGIERLRTYLTNQRPDPTPARGTISFKITISSGKQFTPTIVPKAS